MDTPKTEHRCRYCEKSFQKETSLAVHVCEQKRRWQQEKEIGVQIGFQAYLKFYEITQGSARTKTYDDFARSSYYRAFVKFGRYCVNIRAINVPRLTEWVIQQNKKLDHWCQDRVYGEYICWYIRHETMEDALQRAIEQSLAWQEQKEYPAADYLRYGNPNVICHDISTGRVSPWAIYNCESGQRFLSTINQEQIAMIWHMIDSDFWQKKFRDYAADTEYAKQLLQQAGW